MKMPNPKLGLSDKLFFAGQVTQDSTYGGRTKLLSDVKSRGVNLYIHSSSDGNTLFRTSEIAPSAQAVLGFGRPGGTGWIDTRVFQYISAGAILFHDDVGGYFEPWVHYIPYESGSAESIAENLDIICKMNDSDRMRIRQNGFDFGQKNHSSVVRCAQVLKTLSL